MFKKIDGIVFHPEQQKTLEKYVQKHEEAESKEEASSPDAGDTTKPIPIPGKDFWEFKHIVETGEAWLTPGAATQWKTPKYVTVSPAPKPAASARCAKCLEECVYCTTLGAGSSPVDRLVRKRLIGMLPGIVDLMKEVEWGSNSQGAPECPWCRATDDHYNCVCRRDPKNSPHEASVPKHLKDCPAAILLCWERS